MQNKIDSNQIAQKLDSQGEKIKYLRRLCGLSRKDFFDKYQISESTLRSWELNISPISDRLMEKFLEALSQEGLSISAAWIRSSTQELPNSNVFELGIKNNELNLHEKTVEDEAQFFLRSGPGRLISRVKNTFNKPFFQKSDLVGGECCPLERDDLILDNFCLVQLSKALEWEIFLVKPSPHKNAFTLLCAQSYDNPIDCRILYDITIDKIAPIIWHRRLTLEKKPLKEVG